MTRFTGTDFVPDRAVFVITLNLSSHYHFQRYSIFLGGNLELSAGVRQILQQGVELILRQAQVVSEEPC